MKSTQYAKALFQPFIMVFCYYYPF